MSLDTTYHWRQEKWSFYVE